MDRKILKNYIYNIAYQLVKIILPLITVPYLYQHVGAETLGISDFASNIAGWFILFGILGVNTYGNREIAKVRDNKDNLNKTFFEVFAMQVVNMLIATVFYFLYVNFTVHENQTIYYLTGLIMLASMLDITWFFYGVEDFKKASIRNIVVKVIGVACILLFVKKPEDLYLYVIINCGSELIGQGIMFVQLRQYINKVSFNLKEAYHNHFKATFTLFVPTIAISVYTMLDQTMIGYLYSSTHLNYYKTAMSFIKMFLYFITSIGTVMLPRVTNVFYTDENGKEKAENMINTTMKIAMMLALPMSFGMIGIAPKFIPWYIPSAPIIQYLIMLGVPIIILISMSNVTGTQYMVPTGQYKQYSTSVVCGAVLNFFINLLLIPSYGAYGAIVGSVVAELTVTVIQFLYIRKSVTINFFNSSYIKYLIASALMLAVVWGIGNLFTPSFLCNIIQIGCGVIVYFVFLFITKEELLVKVVGKVIKHA